MVLKEVRCIELEELPNPEPGPHEVVIKVAYCGLCMTDVHMYNGSLPVKTPIVLGHECSGIVSEVGREVSQIDIGDYVVLNPLIHCGRCRYCLSGRTNLCENALAMGGAGEVIVNGAYAEYIKAPERNVIKCEKSVSLKRAALTEPLACVLHGIKLAKIAPGDRVVIIGAGPIGLLLVQLSALSGSSQRIVLDLRDDRLDVAMRMGATDVINPKSCDPVEAVKRVTEDEFADVVIEAVGSPTTVQEAFKYVKKGGRIVIFGVSPKDSSLAFSPFDALFRELEVVGAYSFTTDDFLRSIRLISKNKVDLDTIITEVYPLERLKEAIIKAERGEGLKKLISVNKDLTP